MDCRFVGVRMCVCVHVCIHVCMHVCVYIHICVCVCLCVCAPNYSFDSGVFVHLLFLLFSLLLACIRCSMYVLCIYVYIWDAFCMYL